MDIQQFLEKYNGQGNIGNTVENKGECTGLVMKWLEDQGLKHVWGDAANLLINADPNVYEIIKNTPDAIPEQGDCIVWTAGFNGTYGHTAIVVKGNIKTFEVFEQNNPLGNPCRLHTYPDYAYVDGWFRKKHTIIPQPIAQQLAQTDIIISIYMGILGADPTQDEINSRLKQLKLGIPLHDIVSQVLNKDRRSPVPKLKSQLDNLKNTIWGKWTWLGLTGWKNRLSQLKQLLPL